jgi:mannan endo-1,4-beta-mannosidase
MLYAAAGALALAVAVATVTVAAQPAHAAAGLRVSGTGIVEANGASFIMRGTSHAHVWYPSQTSSIANIKALGANTVRVVLSGGRWGANGSSDVSNIIALCKASKLICVLENHDTTGYGEDAAAYSLDTAANYWVGLKSVLQGQENYVVINIGNEPYGNTNVSGWTSATTGAIRKLRSNGIEHLLMVDAPNWGQDWSGTMRDNAATVLAADTYRNTVFSVHMYGVYDTADEVTSYVSAFKSKNLALVVGEFGNNHSDGNPNEDAIMATAVAQGIGYLGWSWSGNGSGVEYLDQVTNFNPSQLTSWGTRLFNGSNGIKATAKEATVYSGVIPTATASPTATSPTASPTASPTPTANPTAPNGYPYCASSASDPDGDGWGWENSRSCVVRGGAADVQYARNGYPYCASSSSDPDGDGWGWEFNRSCVVRGGSADR